MPVSVTQTVGRFHTTLTATSTVPPDGVNLIHVQHDDIELAESGLHPAIVRGMGDPYPDLLFLETHLMISARLRSSSTSSIRIASIYRSRR